MSDGVLTVEFKDSQFVVAGASLTEEIDRGSWSATKLDRGRVMLTSQESDSGLTQSQGFARCSINMLHDLLFGLNHRHWTGMVVVDTGFGQKKLYFNNGSLTFAGSSLMDDRLGEVIYREGMISLDQLTTSAVQVDRSTKFGQILLRERTFSNTELWNALKAQVREIFRSVFLVSEVYVEFGPGTPPTEVTFEEGTDVLIENAQCSGAQFRAFYGRLNGSTCVKVIEGERVKSISPGTFMADVIELTRQNESIEELLAKSKLTDMNTLWVLHRLSCLGYVSFSNLSPAKSTVSDPVITGLRGKLDAFSMLENMTIKAFTATQVAFPLPELQRFAWSLNDGNLAAIYVDDSGMLGTDCFGNIMSQCESNRHRVAYFEARLDSLIRYVLQMCGDLLPSDAAKSIRKQYAEISA